MATTTNYGWTTPDDTALVKDGAAAIRTLGSSVDTTTKNLNPSTTLGDIEYRSSTANVNTRLPLGTAGQVLKVNSGATAPEWATDASGIPATIFDAKGDIIAASAADTAARLAVGANDTVLTADSSTATGLKWATPAAGGGFALLSTTSASGASFTISSISGSYKHLLIVGKNFRSNTNDEAVSFRFNSDTGSNYNSVNQKTENTTYSASVSNSGTSLSGVLDINNEATASEFSQFAMWLYNYTATDNIFGIMDGRGAGFSGGSSTRTGNRAIFSYDCSAAITSITIFGVTEFLGGTVYIYGVS